MKLLKLLIIIIVLYEFLCTRFKTITGFKSSTKSQTSTNTSTNNKSTSSTASSTASSSSTATNTHTQTELNSKIQNKMGLSFRVNSKITRNTNNPQEVIDYNYPKKKFNGNAYWIGWAKYFKIVKGQKPSTFFKNMEYYKQQLYFPDLNKDETEEGYNKYITNEYRFFVTLFEKSIVISTSREKRFQTIFDVIDVDNIAPISDSHNNIGGIREFGSFTEGICIRLTTTKEKLFRPLKTEDDTVDYVLCFDTKGEMKSFDSSIVQQKLKQQKEDLIDINFNNIAYKNETLSDLGQAENPNNIVLKDREIYSQDGKWVILSNWSKCSVLCGGGYSILKRTCIKPIGNGMPCQGEDTVRKSCNEISCDQYYDNIKKRSVNITKPIVKIMEFSARPQRFTKCKVKESDVLIFKDMNINGENERMLIPVRIVMNNYTIAVYESEDFFSNEFSFDLEKTQFFVSQKRSFCFILTEKSKELEVCPFDRSLRDSSFVNEWQEDFNLFSRICHTPRPTDKDKRLTSITKKKMEELAMEIDDDKNILIAEKKMNEKVNEESKHVTETLDLALEALKKQTRIEQMIKREEQLREATNSAKLKEILKLEEDKAKKLDQKIKEKELLNLENEKINEEKRMAENIKSETIEKLKEQRKILKEDIDKMKDKAKIQEMELRSQIINMRMKIAQKIQDSNKQGNSDNCKKTEEVDRLAYCDYNFQDNYEKYQKCKEADTFCYICCQNEFGEKFGSQREECTSKNCDKK